MLYSFITLQILGSAHFVDKKMLKQKLHAALQKWFYNPEEFKKQAESRTNITNNQENTN